MIRGSFLLACALLFLTSCTPLRDAERAGEPRLVKMIRDGQKIAASTKIAPGVYPVEDFAGDGVLQVISDDVTLDLTGVVLVGAEDHISPDAYFGIGVRAEGVSGLTIIGGSIRGFRVGIEVVGGSAHRFAGIDLSGNFRQRLKSTPDAEHRDDWLWPHRNDNDEWAQAYGAGLHLKSVSDSRVERIRVRDGQNGIILSRSRAIEVRDCDASYLSGWGLALWRTTDSLVEGSRFDYCVRGYSHGVYDRGQDSAGILAFEQCSRNTFRNNSATHGGDGFFLFAGVETLEETGRGGSNDNLIEGNDFSCAVANAIEATFSRGNRFVGNTLSDSNYGVWAGYSSASAIVGNTIERNRYAGVAIEHGQENVIAHNQYRENPIATSLWWDEDPQFARGPFGRENSVASEKNWVGENRYERDRVALDVRDSGVTYFDPERVAGADRPLRTHGEGPIAALPPRPELVPHSAPPGRSINEPGRESIFIDEWGPYEGEGMRTWPTELRGVPRGRVHLLGPPTPFRIDAIAGGVEVTPRSGMLPATVEVTPGRDAVGRTPFTFVAITEDGELTVDGELLVLDWEIEYFSWEPAGPHTPPRDFAAVRASTPIGRESRSHLDHTFGGGGPIEGGPVDYFATVARSDVKLPPGEYQLVVTSDDGVRVRLDGKLVHDDWTWHPPRTAEIPITLDRPSHSLEVEHFEIDGHAVLSVRIVPLSPGRPSPAASRKDSDR